MRHSRIPGAAAERRQAKESPESIPQRGFNATAASKRENWFLPYTGVGEKEEIRGKAYSFV